jgi:hypothetical protein
MKVRQMLPGSVDESVWYVMVAMLGALFLGGLFLVFSIEVVVPATVAGMPAGADVAAPATKSAAESKPAPAATPAGGTAGTAGRVPDPKAMAAQAESVRARLVTEGKTRNAARWAGLLWAFACCAVGAFLGFIFGIPRSLSSDTARTTVAASTRWNESPSARGTVALAVSEKEEAAREVDGIGKQVTDAEAALARLRTAAGAGADGDPQVLASSKALAGLRENTRNAEAVLLDKTNALQNAEAIAGKDQRALPSVNPAGGARPEPVHTQAPSTAVNTNLEQISDWLTKIIVGVSLVNSDRVGQAMLGVGNEMAASFGGPGSRSLALATLTYFGVIGLLGGYLLTRLFLQRAFEALGSRNLVEQHPG